jgi:hypothetical protein
MRDPLHAGDEHIAGEAERGIAWQDARRMDMGMGCIVPDTTRDEGVVKVQREPQARRDGRQGESVSFRDLDPVSKSGWRLLIAQLERWLVTKAARLVFAKDNK